MNGENPSHRSKQDKMIYRSIFFALLLVTCSVAEQYAPLIDADCSPCQADICASDCMRPGFWVNADLIYWQTHIRSLDYAASEDGNALAIGAGQTHRVDFDRDAGIRAELGHMTTAGWGVSVTYTEFDSSGTASVLRPPGIGQLFSTLSHPGGPEEADAASASTSLDYQTLDLMARTSVVETSFKRIDVFGGVRWADIQHELNASYNGRDFVNAVVNDSIDVEAFGFLCGGEVHWRMARGWSVFGRSSIAAMYGRIQTTRLETNLNGFEQLVDWKDSYQEPLFNFDTRLGLSKSCGPLEIRAGYDLNIWTGLGDRMRFVDDIEEATSAAASGDVLLEGFFLQAGASG
jgi:hypothetical protein